jgi:nitrogen regulatory protein P-II 2
MKMIVAVIKPSRLDAVLDAVTRAGATGLTVSEVRGYGRQKGKTEAVVEAANTGKIGDGKLFVLDLESALRIRTGERDLAAITG